MLPQWSPWIIIGGLFVMILSWIASKYQNRIHSNKAFMQDFLSGSVIISFLGFVSPNIFPALDSLSFSLPSLSGSSASNDDYDLQVGPMS
jgi:hypothetical protein